jgi:hypothetical protein
MHAYLKCVGFGYSWRGRVIHVRLILVLLGVGFECDIHHRRRSVRLSAEGYCPSHVLCFEEIKETGLECMEPWIETTC